MRVAVSSPLTLQLTTKVVRFREKKIYGTKERISLMATVDYKLIKVTCRLYSSVTEPAPNGSIWRVIDSPHTDYHNEHYNDHLRRTWPPIKWKDKLNVHVPRISKAHTFFAQRAAEPGGSKASWPSVKDTTIHWRFRRQCGQRRIATSRPKSEERGQSSSEEATQHASRGHGSQTAKSFHACRAHIWSPFRLERLASNPTESREKKKNSLPAV